MDDYVPKPFRSSSDLLKMYRAAYEKSKYMQDIDDKLLAYNEVINYCSNSKRCIKDESIKRNQVLFWTYNNIGDMFLNRNSDKLAAENYIYAMQYYQNALEFTRNRRERYNTFEKISHIYHELQDEDGLQKTREQMAMEEDDSMKRQAFMKLAQTTDDTKLQATYLENALNFVVEENVSVATKCKNTLEICQMLLDIYEHGHNKSAFERIKALQKKTQELLN